MRGQQAKNVDGLQAILGEAINGLDQIKARDLDWVRTTVSAVNSGNGLLRTKQRQESLSRRSSKPAANRKSK